MKDRLLAQLDAIDAVLRERQTEALREAVRVGRDQTPYSEAVHFMRCPICSPTRKHKPLPQGREIWLRVRWYRVKRWLSEHPILTAVLVSALVMAFAAGKLFAGEPALSCVPSADGFLPPDCESSSVSTLKEWLAGGALLLLFVGSVLVLHVLMFNDTPPDEGRVLPGYRPDERRR